MLNTAKQILLIACVLWLQTDGVVAAPRFTPDSQPTGWISKPAVTFFDLSHGANNYYQLDYRKDRWSGNVIARHINSTARVQTTGPWDEADPTLTTAASLLDGANYGTGRKIATYGGPFRWASLTEAAQTAIGSEAILNFVRGDRSNEEPNGLSLRQRESVMGDVLHSNIYFWNDGINQSLYVGSNDGMLHAFDANTGVEIFAYIPSMVIPNLSKLTNNSYVHSHFVDGPISIDNMNISGTRKTILVGGLGAGGAGLYALDVTTPTVESEADVAGKVLWELTATGSFSNLGHTYGTPLLTKLGDGTAAVIFGNGYVNAGNGHAVLYIVNAVTGALISAIDTGSGSTMSPNGLSSPTLFDKDGDAKPEYAYAGDIDGNLWKFDLSNNTSSLVLTTSPVQAITSAPVIRPHPLGGQMINFATGRILTSGDKTDTSVHYVYGVWDGAPDENYQTIIQTFTASTFGNGKVRTVTDHSPDWSTGHHKGWKVALPPGERVVGERPFYNNGRFYFLSTNPTIGTGENWLNELVFNTGGPPGAPIFDLNEDGSFNDSDLADNNHIPVSKYLGSGVFSQPLLVKADGFSTTLYAFHPDLPVTDGVPTPPDDPGVSGGHFDFDIYYYGGDVTETIITPTQSSATGTICKKTSDVEKEYDAIADKICVDNATIPSGYSYLTDYITGSICKDNQDTKKIEYNQTVTCNMITSQEVTSSTYLKQQHEHEYDDKYDVTGVNMLNASVVDFNLPNALSDATTPFRILVMNQYLNPAATLSVGGAEYESVKTYGGLASETNAETLLQGLKEYTREDIDTLIYNLPIDAFKSRDWWGDGGILRAGLIPTQTDCVNRVNANGSVETPGPNDERFNGALTLQIISADTPASALELNGPSVSYGGRVRQEDFTTYVLAEYTSFWHHPNTFCYGETGWVADPPEDFTSSDHDQIAADGSADPKDGVFGAGLAIIGIEVIVSIDGLVTTTTTTYSDNTQYIKIETINDDDSMTTYQLFRDGTEEIVTTYTGSGGKAGFIDPNTGSPEEELSDGIKGRQSWRSLID